MDIKQQTKNVAAQGRFGDSMLLHVNPAEVKGLASAMPITTNPETGQPEAFLPFLAPMLGSLIAPTILAGTGLSAAAMAGIGAGLATYAQTGGSGSKALISGLTAGLGAKALNTAAQGVPTEITTTPPIDPNLVGPPTPPVPTTLPTITPQSTLMDTGSRLFSGGLDEGLKNIAGAAMTPTGMLAAGAAGTGAVMQSQEDFEAMLRQMGIDEEERKKRMYEMYPEQIPIATGGSTNFADGKSTSIDIKNNYINYLKKLEEEAFKLSRQAPGDNPTGLPMLGARNKMTAGQNYIQARKDVRNALRNLTPENLEAYERGDFKRLSTGIAKDEIEKYLNFVSSANIVNQVKDVNKSSGGTIGFQRGRNINISYDPRETNNFNPGSGAYYEPGGRSQFIARRANPIPAGFMPGFMPEFSYFQNLNPSATSIQGEFQSTSQPVQPPFMGGRRRFGGFGGFGNPFMQTPSYQSFYGNPQMGGMYNPYARFNQQPIQPYFPPPPVYTPPPPPDDIPPPSDGGDLPPPDGPIIPPIDDGIGRKGRTRSVEPISPPDDFITPGPVATGPVIEPKPINVPINKPMPFNPPIDMSPRQTIEDNPPFIKDTPPPTVTIPIEGGADVTIPDFSKINIPNLRNDFMSIERIGNNSPEIGQVTDHGARYYGPPLQVKPFTPPTPAAPGNTPTMQQFKPPMSGGIFGAPMFAEGGDTDKELPNKGLEALYASGEKGKKAVEAMGYQEGQDINMPTRQSTDMMMQDPIVQEVIQFILGETDNNEIINEFIIKYGQEQLMMLRDMVLKQAAGNPDVQTEGLIQGVGNSGMADDLPMNIGNKPIAAVSQDEYIIPADVVSMLGDGSSDAGSKQLDGMLDRVRMAKTGGKTQAAPLNPEEVLPA